MTRHTWTCQGCGYASRQRTGEDMGDWHVRIARHHHTTCPALSLSAHHPSNHQEVETS